MLAYSPAREVVLELYVRSLLHWFSNMKIHLFLRMVEHRVVKIVTYISHSIYFNSFLTFVEIMI